MNRARLELAVGRRPTHQTGPRPRESQPDFTTGGVLSGHLIEPTKTYWRNQNKEPGRWPGSNS